MRRELLDELSALLGAPILDVRWDPGDPGRRDCHPAAPHYRPPRAPCWWLSLPERVMNCRCGLHARRGGGMRQVGPSGTFRNPRKLNALARSLGRDDNLPRLTAEDGRRAVRLLHEVIECQPEEAA